MQYKSESRFRNQLLAEMKEEGFEVQAIETGGTGRGVPDVFFARRTTKAGFTSIINGWIELKNIQGELPDRIHIAFRPGQFEWIRRFIDQEVNVYLGISCELGIFMFKNYEISDNYSIEDFTRRRCITKMKDVASLF